MEDNKQPREQEEPGMIDKVRQSMYYFIIAIISFIALVFLPMLGTTMGLAWNLPTTAAGWTVWVVMKVIVATLNLLIFYSFMQQGKLNVKDNENYLKAQEILRKIRVKEVQPRSPAKWNGQQYGKKGVTIFLSTALATVALTQAILAFNWVEMLTYLFTIIMGIVFGVLQMKSAEDYWKEEYYLYALRKLEERQEEEKKAQIFAQTLKNRAISQITPEFGQTPQNEPTGEIKKIKEEIENVDDRG